ncbi:MAG: hypothetical protein IPQ09_07225 [Myxococcales bacterium]|nr:hypothetical protein [Myxococcales bacterium]
MTEPQQEPLPAPVHCTFAVDRVSRDPATTAWKQRARSGQARWREAHGHPIGAHPYRGGSKATPVGSRLELGFARSSGANFLTPGALAAVRARLAAPEKYQMISEERLWADLLSSMPLCFNLFGDLASSHEAATRAVRAWWPDAPDAPESDRTEVRFEYSPGRRDPSFLGNQSAFDAAFEIAMGSDKRAIVGIETKYHEHAIAEPAPKAAALARYAEVTERSGVFVEGWRERIVGTDLQQIWLDHLLVLAMLQHPSRKWAWGRFVLTYPEGNPSFAGAAARYREVLRDEGTFEARTLEGLVGTPGVLPDETASALRERYFPWGRAP